MIRVTIQWTETAKNHLLGLPKAVQKGLVKKIGKLRDSDPRQAGKPLVGPFAGYRRITYGRYRAILGIEEEKTAGGGVLIHVKVTVVAAGIRKEHDKKDIYRIAQKLVDLGLIPAEQLPESE
jgi:mRNA interferase RelE/StbE